MVFKRAQGESGFYHIFARGVCRQIIFENDVDKEYLLNCFKRYLPYDVKIYAWCLMTNHYHLIVRGDLEELANYFRTVNSAYARYYNEKHDRVGTLFQGRYGSEPIDDEQYLLSAIRYVHNNPVAAGLTTTCSYQWSSYIEYTRPSMSILCDTSFILDYFASIEAFIDFHTKEDGYTFLDVDNVRNEKGRYSRVLSDKEAVETATELFGVYWQNDIYYLDRISRDSMLRELKNHGLSTRQISRLTGLGHTIVQNA